MFHETTCGANLFKFFSHNLIQKINVKIKIKIITKINKYWEPKYYEINLSRSDFVNLLSQKIERSIKLHISDKKEFGLLLSGGLDSRCILGVCKKKLSCFTISPKKNNEFDIKNPKHLETVTRILFSSRRKMINKNFLKLFRHDNSVAKDLNLNLNQRPEELSNEMFYRIAMKYENLFY